MKEINRFSECISDLLWILRNTSICLIVTANLNMTDISKPVLVQNDPWLEPYTYEIADRIQRFENRKAEIEKDFGSLADFAGGYKYFGLNYEQKSKGWYYREWAPNADAISLIGDFNNWDRDTHKLTKNEFGIWEIFLSDKDIKSGFKDGSLFKIYVESNGQGQDRLPAYLQYTYQNPENHDFAGRLFKPEKEFEWTDSKFDGAASIDNPLIYECHVGMGLDKEGVGTYVEFADEVLPRIKANGYNTLQVMAIQEHPYYGSFGYHVSSFFAPSSRFGSPDDFKYMVNKAHELGLAVIIDLVHSHAVKNIAEGLNRLDGSDDLYFHPGGRGEHGSWDSMLFNYGKTEVLRFLLSNVKYWIEEFHVDGYRYDGVTSMLYFHHGDFVTFDHYDKYFNDVDWDVLVYFQLANTLIKQLKPNSLVIAEDMSGMPGLCRPVKEGGLGFDFRLGMGIPDFWIKYLKHKRDEEWDIYEMWHTLTNRRSGEKTIAYSESHDQAIVGDKTVAFWLMDKEMYDRMHIDNQSHIIDRGIAMHKMIRLFTMALGGEGYLNFIGNEFGHPEWVDFPREGNGWSYKYAKRQWSLVDNEELKYKFLNEFDKGMVNMANSENLMPSYPAQQLNMDHDNRVVVFERNNLIFVFNFSADRSIADYRFKVPKGGRYRVILNSDAEQYGGFGRVDDVMIYPSVCLFGEHFLSVYSTSRTCLVLKNTSL